MKLVHNGNPNRTLAMIFETYPAGHNHWGKN